MIYLELFFSFIQIGLFSIGGGYAALPLIQEQVVDIHHWLTMAEFTDLITISQMTPGPIGINSATFVGNRIAGIGGSVVATSGCVLPSFIIVLTMAYVYFKYKNINIVQGVLSGLRPAVVALIAVAGISIAETAFWGEAGFSANPKDVNLIAIGLFLASFLLLRKFKPNPIWAIAGSGVAGMIIYLLLGV